MSVKPYTHGTNSVENARLQAALRKAAIEEGVPAMDPGPADGDFGHLTTAAVIAAQKHWSLVADGFVHDDLIVFLRLKSAPKLPSILDIFKTATAINQGDLSMIPASAIDYVLNFLQSKIVWTAGILVVAVDSFVSTHWGLVLPDNVNAWITAGLVTAGGAVIAWLRTFANKPKVINGVKVS